MTQTNGKTAQAPPDVPYHIETVSPVPGKIRFRLAEVAASRGIVVQRGPFEGMPNLTAICRISGLSPTTVQPLLRHPEGVKAVRMDTIARLCDALHCQPGDLMGYEPDTDQLVTTISDSYRGSWE